MEVEILVAEVGADARRRPDVPHPLRRHGVRPPRPHRRSAATPTPSPARIGESFADGLDAGGRRARRHRRARRPRPHAAGRRPRGRPARPRQRPPLLPPPHRRRGRGPPDGLIQSESSCHRSACAGRPAPALGGSNTRPGAAGVRSAVVTSIDLNSDLGESFGVWKLGDDEAMLEVVTSANVACGFHAGDPVDAAGGVHRGRAQPACRSAPRCPTPTSLGFGRRYIDIDPARPARRRALPARRARRLRPGRRRRGRLRQAARRAVPRDDRRRGAGRRRRRRRRRVRPVARRARRARLGAAARRRRRRARAGAGGVRRPGLPARRPARAAVRARRPADRPGRGRRPGGAPRHRARGRVRRRLGRARRRRARSASTATRPARSSWPARCATRSTRPASPCTRSRRDAAAAAVRPARLARRARRRRRRRLRRRRPRDAATRPSSTSCRRPRTVLVELADRDAARSGRGVAAHARARRRPTTADGGRSVEIPVRYDGDDLAAVAAAVRHVASTRSSRVTPRRRTACAFCGFAPGFAYLTGLDPALHLPRRPTPRTRVPGRRRSPSPPSTPPCTRRRRPGGWHLIGHTDAALWDADRATSRRSIRPGHARPVRAAAMTELVVVAPGWATTIQDAGRPGLADIGVPHERRARRRAARRAQPARRQPGGRRRAGDARRPARPADVGRPSWRRAPSARRGRRAGRRDRSRSSRRPATLWGYLAVRGGIAVAPVLGSRSQDSRSGLGPPPITPGSRAARSGPTPARRSSPTRRRRGRRRDVVDVWPGPRVDWFVDGALDAARRRRRGPCRADVSRVGARLDGPPLAPAARRRAAERGAGDRRRPGPRRRPAGRDARRPPDDRRLPGARRRRPARRSPTVAQARPGTTRAVPRPTLTAGRTTPTWGYTTCPTVSASASSWRRSTKPGENPTLAIERDLELIAAPRPARLGRGVDRRAPLGRHRDHRLARRSSSPPPPSGPSTSSSAPA